MTRLFHQMLVSADGYIAGPNGEFDWHTVDDDFSRYIDEMLRSIDMIVMGRVTYEGLCQYWPTAHEPEAPLMNGLRKTVFSSALAGPPSWTNTTLTADDPVATVEAMKQTAMRQIGLFASAHLAATLADAGLIDEYRLLIAPVFLGGGKRLFPRLDRRHTLRLVDSVLFESGMTCLTYEPVAGRRR
jgi:dihydrofolate reductase